MTYREPAELPTGAIVDANALAAHVEQLESRASDEKAQKERRREAQIAATRAKANRRGTRLTTTRDHGGSLLTISHQTEPKGGLWAGSIFSVLGVLSTIAGLIWFDGEVKALAALLAIATGFPLWGLWVVLRNRRALHVYATHNGFFVLFRHTPDRAMAMGRVGHLEFDVRNEGGGMKKMMPKYDGRRLLGDVYCDQLTPRDMATLEGFARSTGIRVS